MRYGTIVARVGLVVLGLASLAIAVSAALSARGYADSPVVNWFEAGIAFACAIGFLWLALRRNGHPKSPR